MKVAKEHVKEKGLTTLYEPDDPDVIELDIIFVHGLGGHPVNTWLHSMRNIETYAQDPATLTGIARPSKPVPTRSRSLIRDLASPNEKRGKTLKKRHPDRYYTSSVSQGVDLLPRPQSAEPMAQEVSGAHDRPLTLSHLARKPSAGRKSTAAALPTVRMLPDRGSDGKRKETYWLLDLLPDSCPNARILTYGFPTHVAEGKLIPGQPDIFARGRELLESIDELRRGVKAGRDMVFVTHSTGGVIVKEMIRLASNLLDVDDEGLLASIASVIFMGSPLGGTDYGSVIIAMRSMAAAIIGVASDDEVLEKMLGGDEDAHLTHLGRDAFEAVWREYNFRVKVYRETALQQPSRSWAELGLALRRDASSLADNPEEDEDLPGSHADMCKFASRRDEGFQLVSSYVTRLVHYQALKSRQLTEREKKTQQVLADPGASYSGSVSGLPQVTMSSSTARTIPRWLVQQPAFQAWLQRSSREDTNKVLQLAGPPGSGTVELLASLQAHIARHWAPETHSSAIITITADQGETLLESVVFGDANNRELGNDGEYSGDDEDHDSLASKPNSIGPPALETPQGTLSIPNTPVRALRSLLSQLYAYDPRLRNLVRKRTATAGPLHGDDFSVETFLPSTNYPYPAKHHHDLDHHSTNITTRRWSDPADSTTNLLLGAQTETRGPGHGAPAKVLDDVDIGTLFLDDYLCLGPTKRQQQQHLLDGRRTHHDDFKVEIPSIRRVFILVDATGALGETYFSGLLWCLSQLARRSEFSVCVASTVAMLPRTVSSRAAVRSPSDSTLLIQVPEENAEEIRLYLDTHLASDMEERPAIAAKMVDKGAGVLLWVELVTKIVNDASEEGVSGEIVLSMLDDIVPERNGGGALLDDLYAWKLRRLSGVEQAQALAVMQWVILAPEPLRLNDLLVALRLTLLACRRGVNDNDHGRLWDTSKTLVIEPAMSLKELRAADGDNLGIGTAMDSPTQFWKWLHHLTQGLLRLESEGSADSAISSEPLGLQRVRPTHKSVQHFFLKGKGFQTLLPITSDPHSKLPSTDRFIDTSYYTLLHVCLLYLNITELDSLGREKPPLNPAPGSALPPEETSKWRAHTDAQRRMVMASYPFLCYAVDHLVFHLLCPRDFRYFLPQGALLALFSANRCRIWRRWTHLLGFSIADASPDVLLARAGTGPAGRLLAPVYGARYRLERVLRRVWRIAVGQQGSGEGGSTTTPRTTPRRAHFRSRSDVSERSVVFMLMGGEDPLKASWLVPASPVRAKGGDVARTPIGPGTEATKTLANIKEMGEGG